MTLSDAIRTLDHLVPDPHTGLPEELFRFISRSTPLVNVDLLIRDDRGRTLLTWRSDQDYGSGWHVPGGIIRYKETSEQRIRETARHELGATVACESTPVFLMESISQERDRGHFISLLYRCRLTSGPDPQRECITGPPAAGSWRWHEGPPPDLLPVQDNYRTFLELG